MTLLMLPEEKHLVYLFKWQANIFWLLINQQAAQTLIVYALLIFTKMKLSQTIELLFWFAFSRLFCEFHNIGLKNSALHF